MSKEDIENMKALAKLLKNKHIPTHGDHLNDLIILVESINDYGPEPDPFSYNGYFNPSPGFSSRSHTPVRPDFTATEKTDNPLYPCPFCYSSDVFMDRDNGSQIVTCNSCTARGPEAQNKEEAINKWNEAHDHY